MMLPVHRGESRKVTRYPAFLARRWEGAPFRKRIPPPAEARGDPIPLFERKRRPTQLSRSGSIEPKRYPLPPRGVCDLRRPRRHGLLQSWPHKGSCPCELLRPAERRCNEAPFLGESCEKRAVFNVRRRRRPILKPLAVPPRPL